MSHKHPSGLPFLDLFCDGVTFELFPSAGISRTERALDFPPVWLPAAGEMSAPLLSVQVRGLPRGRLHVLALPGVPAHRAARPSQRSHAQLRGHLGGGPAAQRDHLGRGAAAGGLRHRNDR